jgi:hypothetical protein
LKFGRDSRKRDFRLKDARIIVEGWVRDVQIPQMLHRSQSLISVLPATMTYGPDLPLYSVGELPIKSLYTLTPIEKNSSKVPSLHPLALAY